jgi:LPS export ABC transporter protein LptC
MRGLTFKVIISLAMVGLLFGSLYLANQLDNRAKHDEENQTEVKYSFFDTFLIGKKDGIKEWELKAQKLEESQGEVFLEEITIGKLFKDGKEYLLFTAQRGFWHQDSEVFKLTGDVKVYKDGELVLTTDEFVWNGEEEVFQSQLPVELYHKGNTIYAQSMAGYPNEDLVILQGNVHLISGDMHMIMKEKVVYDLAKEAFSGTGGGQVVIAGSKKDSP